MKRIKKKIINNIGNKDILMMKNLMKISGSVDII